MNADAFIAIPEFVLFADDKSFACGRYRKT